MQLQKTIESLGYTPNEAKVYLASLSLGEAHVSDIAAKAKLPRTTVQLILETLQKSAVMNFYVQRRYKYWVAENPERLLADFRKREEVMRKALPELTAIRTKSRGKRADHTNDPLGVFRMLADSSAQAVLIANEAAEIEYVNIPWEEQFGYSLKEVQGKSPRLLQSGQTSRDVYKRMWATLEAETMFQSDEIVDRRKDGSFFTLLTTIFPVRHNGKLYYIQILDDLKARKRALDTRRLFVRTAVQ